jgi:hypothetical protein
LTGNQPAPKLQLIDSGHLIDYGFFIQVRVYKSKYSFVIESLVYNMEVLMKSILFCSILILVCIVLLSCSSATKPDKVAKPVLTPPGGSYEQSQLVSIYTTTDGAEIRYTLDGSTPPANSYIYSAPFEVTLGTTVNAYAYKPGMDDSDVAEHFYSGIVPTPVVTPESGTYIPDTYIRISINGFTSATNWPEGTTVRYTLDGTEPDTTSILYEFPFLMEEPLTIKARAYRYNWTPSPIISATYSLYPTLEILGSCETNGTAMGMDISGSYIYIADRSWGLSVVDISSPEAPAVVGEFLNKGNTTLAEVWQNLVFLGDLYFGIQVIDVNKPDYPYLVNTIGVPGTLTAMTQSGDYLYVANTTGSLTIYHIIDALTVSPVGVVYLPGISTGMVVSGNYLYSAAGKSGLAIVDVSNPASPLNVSTCTTDGDARDVAVGVNHAYVTYEPEGLQVIDISNPLAPFVAGSLTAPAETRHVTAPVNGYVYLTGSDFDLLKINVSNPAQPLIVAYCQSWGAFHKAVFSSGYLYVSNLERGILVVEP